MRRKKEATGTLAERLAAWCEQQPEIVEMRQSPRNLRRAMGAEAARIIVGVPVDANFSGANRKTRRAVIRQARHARALQLEAFRAKGTRQQAQANRRAVRILQARRRELEVQGLRADWVIVEDITDPALD